MSILLTENILATEDPESLKLAINRSFDLLNKRLEAQIAPANITVSTLTVSAGYVQAEVQIIATAVNELQVMINTLLDILVTSGTLK